MKFIVDLTDYRREILRIIDAKRKKKKKERKSTLRQMDLPLDYFFIYIFIFCIWLVCFFCDAL